MLLYSSPVKSRSTKELFFGFSKLSEGFFTEGKGLYILKKKMIRTNNIDTKKSFISLIDFLSIQKI